MIVFEALFLICILFAGALFFTELGRRVGTRRLARRSATEEGGLGAFEGAIFGLMGLLLAFTFSGAATRFDLKRDLIVQESNAIGTAFLRIDLLPAAAQPSMREKFRNYVDARAAYYRLLPESTDAIQAMDRATRLQGEIWSQAVTASHEAPSPTVATLVLPSLNEMIDITSTRAVAHQTHPPEIVFALLIALVLVSAMLAGFGTAGKTRSSLHTVGFAVIMAITVYVIFDLEYPRFGLLRIDSVDRILVQLRATMN